MKRFIVCSGSDNVTGILNQFIDAETAEEAIQKASETTTAEWFEAYEY